MHRLRIKDRENASTKDFFLMQRKNVDQTIMFATRNFYYDKFADCVGYSRQVFQVLKGVNSNRVESRQLSSLEIDEYEVGCYTESANAFNYHFVSVGPKSSQSLLVKKLPKTDWDMCANQSFSLLRTSKNECPKVIQ